MDIHGIRGNTRSTRHPCPPLTYACGSAFRSAPRTYDSTFEQRAESLGKSIRCMSANTLAPPTVPAPRRSAKHCAQHELFVRPNCAYLDAVSRLHVDGAFHVHARVTKLPWSWRMRVGLICAAFSAFRSSSTSSNCCRLGEPKNPTFGALNLRWRCWKRHVLRGT